MLKILFLALVVTISLVLSGCSYGKYEGQSAEEWADEYYKTEQKYKNFKDCAENYDLNIPQKGALFNYCK